jgi:large subunit ribosomal protein L55
MKVLINNQVYFSMYLQLPLDLSTLSEEEQRARLERRKPKKKVKIEEDIEDGFDARQYVHLLKK